MSEDNDAEQELGSSAGKLLLQGALIILGAMALLGAVFL